ncbi:hypothetical protein [Sphingobium sp. RAC03]|uniref:hypothetical protein n=1 Tax=Sphingobium sp. RAC03 TaxID=1843368 RepID=UPI00083CDF9F|nr:hypothetical protein [Sphingobium sp. RAC03]
MAIPLGNVPTCGRKSRMQVAVTGGLLLWAVTASIQLYVARQDAREATVQTYNMGRVAAFRDSGADLDKKVAAFNDAAAEGQSLSEVRQNVREAMADHAAKTFAMQDAFGKTATNRYSDELKALQTAVEETTDATNSGAVITALSKVYVARTKLADDVTKKATA